MNEFYDTIIIGGGVSGLSAGMYTGRFQMKTLIIAKEIGGAIILTDKVENYPGFKKISGEDLVEKLREHAEEYDVEIIENEVISIEKKNNFIVKTKNEEYSAKTIIYAAGTKWRKLNVPGEEEYSSKGVHYCALCDGALYKDKKVGVVGGSDSAAKEALLLTRWVKKVFIIYRGEEIHPEPINHKRVMNNDKIEVINNTNVKEIKGDKMMTHVILDNSKKLELDGLFIEIGHIPLTDLAKNIGVELNDKNEIIIDKMSKTNIDGFYASGDVTNTEFKQAITGVSEGVKAAFSAYKKIKEEK